MSAKRPSRQHSGIEDLLRAADTPAPTPKPIASPLPKIQLPKEVPQAPLDWFSAYEKFNPKS
jgi:hypothetical protein